MIVLQHDLRKTIEQYEYVNDCRFHIIIDTPSICNCFCNITSYSVYVIEASYVDAVRLRFVRAFFYHCFIFISDFKTGTKIICQNSTQKAALCNAAKVFSEKRTGFEESRSTAEHQRDRKETNDRLKNYLMASWESFLGIFRLVNKDDNHDLY